MARSPAVVAAVATAFGVPACFYGDVINERPSAEIQRVDSGIPTRGGTLKFRAVMDDPDHDRVFPSWRFEACNAASTCEALTTGLDPTFDVTIPSMVEGAATVKVAVTLQVVDDFGAIARPPQRLELDVLNHDPRVYVQARGREIAGGFPLGVPITISAVGSDEDSDPVSLTWELIPARDSVPALRRFQRLPDPLSGGEEYLLVPDIDGSWGVRVTVDDTLTTTWVDHPILVAPDQAPCLGASDPAPAPGAMLVLDRPRRFSVLVVDDDLDAFPWPMPGDPFLGNARFRWSVRAPGAAAFTPVAADVAAIELDPAQYDPGDRVDVRVEIDDRVGRAVQCAADVATCSSGQDGCLQRQTWSVEVR